VGAPSTRRAQELVFGTGRGIASTVYGTVTTMATIAVYGHETHPWKLAIFVAGSATVLWIAHLYAHGIAESIENRRPLKWYLLTEIAVRELGVVLAAAAPTAALVLGALGVIGEHSAVWLALSLGLATLVVNGVRYARIEKLGPARTLGAIAANVALGLVVVLLKIVLKH
jgi:hypothetical protein